MSDTATLEALHKIFLNFNKRAERSSADILAATFVDSAPMYDLLATRNSQVIYGRRGTGKTHASKFLKDQVDKAGDYAIYIDLRSIGSNGSIYGDSSRAISERAGTLIIDVLNAVLSDLYAVAFSVIDKAPDHKQITVRLDDLGQAISEVSVSGSVELEDSILENTSQTQNKSAEFSLSNSLRMTASASGNSKREASSSERLKRIGREVVHLNFSRVATALSGLVRVLGISRVWLLIDEWSEVPIDLQPYLADLLRRTVLPDPAITLKIAAIEHRSDFAIIRDRGEYTGLELGADIAADLNLDDFLVFDNNQQKAVTFFKNLVFKHYVASEGASAEISSPDQLVQAAFTQFPVFEEFVRSVEGVPRDALNVITKIVTRAFGQKIAMQHVRVAARDWYNQDKASVIKQNPTLNSLLLKIIDEVIGRRKARAFLFQSNAKDQWVEQLFDSRILHLLKKNISSTEEPGVRYDVYKIDYGCYVELINTVRNPTGLFSEEDGGGIEVPRDDYRSIRSAILRLDEELPF